MRAVNVDELAPWFLTSSQKSWKKTTLLSSPPLGGRPGPADCPRTRGSATGLMKKNKLAYPF